MPRPATVHPALPRFAQAITGVICLEALVFGDPWAVAVALALILVALIAPRYSPVNALFRLGARPAADLEPAAPVRFAQVMAAVGLGLALVLRVAGAETASWIIVGAIAAVALFSAITGYCVGCEIYRLLLLRRAGGDGDVRGELGLSGAGPWLVVLTAPGCARCEPVARQLEDVAAPRAIVRVDLARTPAAARLPVKSVPAVIAIRGDGRVRRALAGRLDRQVLEEAAAAV
jgi:hypothetical protein